jgi:hypothetical protein
MAENEKWLRYCRLVIGIDDREEMAVDLSQFRIHFTIIQATVKQPCEAHIKVYNVSPDTINRIPVPERFTGKEKKENIRCPKVIIDAGYMNNHAVIFNGDLIYKTTGKGSNTDSFMMLTASTGDRAYQYSTENKNLAAGWTQKTLADSLSNSFAQYGITNYNLPPMKTVTFPRGKVLYGQTANYFDSLAFSNGWDWGFQNETVAAYNARDTGCKGERAIELNSATGLIGRPSITIDGLQCKALLDPRIEIGAVIHIDNDSIQRDFATDAPADFMRNEGLSDRVTDADGFYRVFSREHEGDTRGDVWESRMVCTTADRTKALGYRTIKNTTPNNATPKD